MAIENPFKNMKIDVYYKYLLVLFGFILIISLFYDIRGLGNIYIQNLSILIIGAAAVVWIWEEGLMKIINDYLYQAHMKDYRTLSGSKKERLQYPRRSVILSVINVIIQLIIWLYVIFIKIPEI